MTLVLAVECGGSRTRAWLASAAADSLSVVAQASEGPGNFQRLGAKGFAALVRRLAEGVGAAPDAIGIGAAGISTPAEKAAARAALAEAGFVQPVGVASDAHATLLGATRGGAGVLVIAGTGSIALGLDAEGNEARCGGWGHQLGDEGSGYALGRVALRQVTRALDGRPADEGYVPAVMSFLGVADRDALAAWIRAHAAETAAVASLAPLVIQRGQEAAPNALAACCAAAGELAGLARAVIARLGLDREAPVVFHGGLLHGSEWFRAKVETALGRTGALTAEDDALRGCATLALRALEERKR